MEIKDKIKEVEKEIEELDRDNDIISTQEFTNKIKRKLEEEDILKSKEEVELILKENIKDRIIELRKEIKKFNEEKQKEINKEFHKIEIRIKELEKELLTCPICFRIFDKKKSFTNHIREYRNKLASIEEKLDGDRKYQKQICRRRKRNDNRNKT